MAKEESGGKFPTLFDQIRVGEAKRDEKIEI